MPSQEVFQRKPSFPEPGEKKELSFAETLALLTKQEEENERKEQQKKLQKEQQRLSLKIQSIEHKLKKHSAVEESGEPYEFARAQVAFKSPVDGAGFSRVALEDSIAPKKMLLLDVLAILEMSVLLHCRIVVLCIRGQESMSSKLTAYSYLWSKFVKGVIALEEQLNFFADSVNELSRGLFPNYPHYPRFSIWRMMIKVWHSQVYHPNRILLHKVFFRLLLNHRITNLFEMRNQHGKGFLDSMPSNFFKLSKLKDKEVFDDFQCFFEKNVPNQTKVRQVLQNFASSIADISFDECSIHFIGHTRVKMGSPYEKLEAGLLKQTKKIYLNLHPLKQGREEFFRFFSEDCKTISLLFLNRSFQAFFNYVSSIAINTLEQDIRVICKNRKKMTIETEHKVGTIS